MCASLPTLRERTRFLGEEGTGSEAKEEEEAEDDDGGNEDEEDEEDDKEKDDIEEESGKEGGCGGEVAETFSWVALRAAEVVLQLVAAPAGLVTTVAAETGVPADVFFHTLQKLAPATGAAELGTGLAIEDCERPAAAAVSFTLGQLDRAPSAEVALATSGEIEK